MPTRISLDFSSCTAWQGIGFRGLEGCTIQGVGEGGGLVAWILGESCCCGAHWDQFGLHMGELRGRDGGCSFWRVRGFVGWNVGG